MFVTKITVADSVLTPEQRCVLTALQKSKGKQWVTVHWVKIYPTSVAITQIPPQCRV